MLTADRLRELLSYDPATGLLSWRVKVSKKTRIGDIAGTVHRERVLIRVGGVLYKAHRLAWLYMMGVWPEREIDHRNTIANDNRWDNLREADDQINAQNRRAAYRNNKTGLLGASLHRQSGRYQARILHNGKYRSLGLFDTPELAHFAYVDAKRQLHEGNTL